MGFREVQGLGRCAHLSLDRGMLVMLIALSQRAAEGKRAVTTWLMTNLDQAGFDVDDRESILFVRNRDDSATFLQPQN